MNKRAEASGILPLVFFFIAWVKFALTYGELLMNTHIHILPLRIHDLQKKKEKKGVNTPSPFFLVRAADLKKYSKKQQKQPIYPQTLLVKMLKSEHSHYT